MHVLDCRNVNDAYRRGMHYLMEYGEQDDSRNGTVVVAPGPVTTVYTRPMERVLLSHPKRKANPFLHLAEALWMLAGRRDAAFMGLYSKQITQYAEDDGLFHGAYGWRWRHHYEMEGGGGEFLPDQLSTIVQMLRKNPLDRRVVLQMWDPVADLGQNKRDLPCNLCVLPRLHNDRLDITVFNRSNDIIWGAYGTNVVTFSVLQEYLAAMIGVEVGVYYQISNNFHAYEDILKKHWPLDDAVTDPYEWSPIDVHPIPLVDHPKSFDEELLEVLAYVEHGTPLKKKLRNSFLWNTFIPMMAAHKAWKSSRFSDAVMCSHGYGIRAPDWKLAAANWLHQQGDSK